MARDRTTPAQVGSLQLEFDLRHSPQKVWRALTDPVLLTEWLLPVVELTLEPGARFAFQAPAFQDWDGKVQCQMLEIDAPRKLSYAWVVGEMEIDTVVTFTLTPTLPPSDVRRSSTRTQRPSASCCS